MSIDRPARRSSRTATTPTGRASSAGRTSTRAKARAAVCNAGSRAASAWTRPLAADTESFQALYRQRLPHYRAADVTISTAGKSLEQIAQELGDTGAESSDAAVVTNQT